MVATLLHYCRLRSWSGLDHLQATAALPDYRLRALSWAEDFNTAVIAQFENEWRAQWGSRRRERIVIVNDQPAGQYCQITPSGWMLESWECRISSLWYSTHRTGHCQ